MYRAVRLKQETYWSICGGFRNEAGNTCSRILPGTKEEGRSDMKGIELGKERRKAFSERLKELADDYYYDYQDTPPISANTMERMNSLLAGTRNPTIEELIQISEDYDVSINYLLTGDELFPSLHRVPEKDAKRLQDEIEELRPEPEV